MSRRRLDPRLHLLVPGSIERRTGGTIYDARIIEALRRSGREVVAHSLAGRFPWPDGDAHRAAARALGAVRTGEVVVVDGLALAALDPTAPWPTDASLVLLAHMPLAEERGVPLEVRAALDAAERVWLRRADRIICTSAHVAEWLAGRGAPRRRVSVAEPGLDDVWRRPCPPAGERRPAPDGQLRLLAVGAVTRVKAQRLLVRALAALRDRPWALEIVGRTATEPDTHRELLREVAGHGLDGRVRLTGELPPDRLRQAYCTADIFVLPSLFESYGMALAEAAAHGLALVATRVGGVPASPAGRAALLVPPGDADALARAIEPLLRDDAARSRLAAAARAAARRLPSWEDVARRFAAEVDRVVSRA